MDKIQREANELRWQCIKKDKRMTKKTRKLEKWQNMNT